MDDSQHENKVMKELIVDVNVIDGFEGLTIEERQRAYDKRLKEGPLFIQAKKPKGGTGMEAIRRLCVVELPYVWQVKSIDFTTRKAVIIPSKEVEGWDVSNLAACGITVADRGIIAQVFSMYFINKKFIGMTEEQANASSINATIEHVARDTISTAFGSKGIYSVAMRGSSEPVECAVVDTRRFLKVFGLDPIELKEELKDSHLLINTDVGSFYFVIATTTPSGNVSLVTLRRVKDVTHPDGLTYDDYFLDSPIVSSAARSPTGLVVPSVRHGDELFHDVVDYVKLHDLDENLHYWEQGFINTRREFLTREQAWLVAQHNNQVKNKLPCDDACRLYSENLY